MRTTTGSLSQGSDEDPVAAVLATAGELAHRSASDGLVAIVILLGVVVSAVTQVNESGGLPHGNAAIRLLLLPFVVVCFGTSVTLVAHSRRTLVRALGEARMRIGAPLDPAVPWVPASFRTPLTSTVLDVELRKLIGAAHRCCDLSYRALWWATMTLLLFVFWTLAGIGAV
jgi:hypothetical protein